MTWLQVFVALMSGAGGALLLTIANFVLNRRPRRVSLIEKQATAIEAYWGRITNLEAEVARLREELRRRDGRIQSLQAEIGRLSMELSRMEGDS